MSTDNSDIVGEVLGAFVSAKEALALLPPPPVNVKPCHLRILNAFYRIRDDRGFSRVSDINKALGWQLPNTTKAINEMAELNIVEKVNLETDRRVVLIKATELGEEHIQKHIVGFHRDFDAALKRFRKSDLHTMINTVRDVSLTIRRIRSEKNTSQGGGNF